MAQGRPSYSAEDIEAFKHEVCRAALRIVSVEGQSALSFRGLAKVLGCSHTRVHGYYPNKQALIEALRDFAFGEFAEALESSTVEIENPRDRLLQAGQTYFKFAHEDREAFQVLFSTIVPVKRFTTDNEQRAWNAIQQPIAAAIDAGYLVGDPDTLTHVFWSAIHGITNLSMTGNIKYGTNIDEILNLIFSGLRRGHGPQV